MPANSPQARPSQRTQVLLLGLLGGIQVADPLIATLTLVKVSDDLNLSASLQSLAAGISTLALAATVIPGGVLADRLGRRKVLAASLLLSSTGQLLSAFSPDPAVFLLGRVITGVALGTTFAAAYGLVKNAVPESERGPALGLFAVVNTLFPLLIAILTGPVTAVSWRGAFLILPVVSLLAFPLAIKLLPVAPRVTSGAVDYVGMVLVGVGVVGLLSGISAAGGGITQLSCWLPILVGLAALTSFAVYGSRSGNPLFPPRIFTHPGFFAAVLLGILFNFASAVSSQMSANFWQYVMHLPTAVIGVASMPVAAAAVIAALTAGRLVKAGVPASRLALSGGLLIVAGVTSLVFVDQNSPYIIFVPMMVLSGLGVATIALIQGNLYLGLAPAQYFGPVTSSKTAVGQFGYALGLTGTTVAVSLFTLDGVQRITGGAISGENSWDAITSYLATGATTNPALAKVSQSAVAGIYTQAFTTTVVISAAFLAVLTAVAVWSLHRRAAKTPMDEFLTQRTPPAATSSQQNSPQHD